jgi:hypothetical protein
LIGAGLALGSLHTSVLCVVAIFVGAAAVLAWQGGERVLVRPAATIVLAVGAVLIAYTALQALPLPAGFVKVLAPHTADVWSRALTPLHEAGPSWISLSLDPTATRIEVLRGAVYVAAFLAALRITSRRDGGGFLSAAVVAAGVAMALAAIVHPALGMTEVFGFYPPGPRIDPRHIAPLLNPNHLAAYLNIAFCVALAAAVAKEPTFPRAFAIGAVLLLAGTQLWVASRGGVLAMGVATAIVLWLSRARASESRATVVRLVPLLAVAILSIAMIVFGAAPQAAEELATAEASKLGAIREMGRMVPTYWLFGAGRGAFESTFPEFREGTAHVVFTHPETIVVQWTAEWGIPIAIAAAAALAHALWPRASAVRSHAALGAWAAVAVTAVHNLVDFSSETPAVVLLASVCAAMVVGGAPDHMPRARVARWSLRPRVPSIAIGAVAVVALAIAAPCIGGDLGADREALRELALAQGTNAETMHAAARRAILRHPAEPYLPFAVALRAGRVRDDSLVPWIARVFERAQVYAPAHLLLARTLARVSPAQARMEYRVTVEQEHSLFDVVLLEVPRLIGTTDDALEVVPKGQDEAPFIDRLIDPLSDRLPSTAWTLNQMLLQLEPNNVHALSRVAAAAVRDLEAPDTAPWCAGDAPWTACKEKAIGLAKALQRIAPDRCVGYALEAQARVASGEGVAGLRPQREAAPRVTDRTGCQTGLVALATKTGDAAAVTTAIDELVHAGCTDERECVDILLFAADVEQARGNPSRALALVKRARERSPENDDLIVRSCQLASQLGMHVEAMQGYMSLARRHPENPQWARAAAAENSTLVRSMPKF